jgi:hypothetical protein
MPPPPLPATSAVECSASRPSKPETAIPEQPNLQGAASTIGGVGVKPLIALLRRFQGFTNPKGQQVPSHSHPIRRTFLRFGRLLIAQQFRFGEQTRIRKIRIGALHVPGSQWSRDAIFLVEPPPKINQSTSVRTKWTKCG